MGRQPIRRINVAAASSARDKPKTGDGGICTTPTAIVTPNLLPCKIHHDGPIEPAAPFWEVRADNEGVDGEQGRGGELANKNNSNTKTAYFRGRKLRGKAILLPEEYMGVVSVTTDRIKDDQRRRRWVEKRDVSSQGEREGAEEEEEEEEDKEEEELVGNLEVLARFDVVVLWGHDKVPDEEGMRDPYVRMMREWTALAGEIHSFE